MLAVARECFFNWQSSVGGGHVASMPFDIITVCLTSRMKSRVSRFMQSQIKRNSCFHQSSFMSNSRIISSFFPAAIDEPLRAVLRY